MMLDAADQRLLVRETSLPGLACLLDPDRFADLAATLAPAADIESAELTYLLYKPATSALAAFRLHRRNGPPLLVQAKAQRPERHAQSVTRPGTDPASADRVLPRHIDALQLTLADAVDDRRLKPVRALLDPQRRGPVFDRLIGHLGIGDRATADRALGIDAVTVLRYKPRRRFVLRLDRAGRPIGLLRLLGRDAFAQALAGASLGAATRGAPLLGAAADHQSLVTAWTPGEALDPSRLEQPISRDATRDQCRRTGATLARLHATRIRPGRRRGRDVEQAAIEATVALLAQLLPTLAAPAARLAAHLGQALADTPWQPALVHGDFSADQVITRGPAVTFIDWDRAGWGDPAGDLGSFAARLDMQVIDGSLTRAAADDALAELVAGYREEAGGLPPGTGLQTASALLKLATESFRRRLPDWPEREAALIERVAALVPAGTDHPASLARALDPGLALPALAEALAETCDDLTLHSATVVHQKRGRRALIAYRLGRGGRDLELLGKWGARGLDQHGFGIQQALARRQAAASLPATLPPSRGPGRFEIAPALAAVPTLALWLQQRLAGEPSTAFFRPGEATGLAIQVAEALADFHARPVATAKHWSAADELAMLAGRLDQAAAQRRDLGDRIRAVLGACKRLAADLPMETRTAAGGAAEGAAGAMTRTAATTGIHRDFHPGQILVDGERLVLVDFDLYARGDPGLDVGNFVAHLIELAIRHHGSPAALAPQAEALVDRYLALNRKVTAAGIEAWTTLGLARHIQLSLAFSDRRATTGAVLQTCEHRLGLSAGPSLPLLHTSHEAFIATDHADPGAGDPSGPADQRRRPALD